MMDWIIFILLVIAMVEMIIISNLSTRMVNYEEKISVLEFEKREAYIRGCREGRKHYADKQGENG